MKADSSATTLALNDIGLKALAIVNIENLHLLALNHICGVHQVLIDGDAAYVVQIGLCDSYAVNLRLQYFNHHMALFDFYVINQSNLSGLHCDATLHALALLPRCNLLHRESIYGLEIYNFQ